MSALAFTQRLAAPPARVFAALTEARHLERWFCDSCSGEPGAGGRLVMRWNRGASSTAAFEANWITWSPPSLLSFRGGHAGYPNGDAGTVAFVLVEDGAGTVLETHHEFPAGEEYTRFRHEWEQAWPRALARLASYLSPIASGHLRDGASPES